MSKRNVRYRSNDQGCRAWRLLAGLVALAAIFVLQCVARQSAATSTRADASPGGRPRGSRLVVLVPGATGSMLRDSSGAVRWGRGIDLLRPHDGGYALVRPIAPGASPSSLEAFAVLESIHLAGLIRKPVYGPLLRGLEAIGYRRGDFASPRPTDTLLPFAWDWRASHAEGAARLARSLETVRRAWGVEVLPVALVCQSSGAHLCRFFAKYGGASLDQVEAGHGRPPERIDVTTIVLVGSSNGGSLRILRELDRGRSYIPLIGRDWRPETLFTFPALYEDLPAYRHDLFVGGEGEALAVDLYDANAWTRYGWSAFGKAARRRLERAGTAGRFGSEAQRLEYLRSTLDRARRFQAALHTDVGWSRPPRYHVIQGKSDPLTPERAVLLRAGATSHQPADTAADAAGASTGGRWRLSFAGDDEVDRDPRLRELAAADGDGHATLESQRWLSPEETAAIAGPPVYVPGAHFEMILTPEASAALADALDD
jgi:hypothetical protein